MSSVYEPGDEIDGELEPDTAIALREPSALEVAFTPAQKELIRAINPDATNAELQVFMYQAARTGLDPIAKQIYLVKRSGKMAIQTGIDGFRLIAARSGLMAGSDDPTFEEGADGWPEKATVTVYRVAADGIRYPYAATARWSEYRPADLDSPQAFMWRKMPHTMLGKVAEALALRKAFPAELSGTYTDDEMAQADYTQIGTTPTTSPPSGFKCPSCEQPVLDNRPAHNDDSRQPAWKCGNRACQGGGDKKDGGRWPWASWDTEHFAATHEGDDDGDLTVSGATMPDPPVTGGFDVPASPESADVWDELLRALSEGAGLGTRGQIEWRTANLCRLMEVNDLWPADSLLSLLRLWPKVETWAELGTKAEMVKFAQKVADAAAQKVTEAMRAAAT